MIKKPKTPKAPKMPKAAGMPAPKMNIRAKSLLRVFKPLLLLPILAIAAILVYFFVPQVVKIGRFTLSLNFYCLVFIAVIAGILLIYVLIRLVGYFVELARIRKQERMLGREEVMRLQQRFENRWKSVDGILKSTGVGHYDMPWYLLLSGSDSVAQPLLDGSGLTFPVLEEARALHSDPKALDRWLFSNEAVFIDTTGKPVGEVENESEQAEWDALLSLLANHRRRCPLNGLLLLIPANELDEDSEQTRKARAKQLLARVQQIQSRLQVRLPLYLVVTRMGKVVGFSEFFGQMEKGQEDQILGWSNPQPPDATFSAPMFHQAFDELAVKIKKRQFVQEGEYLTPESANRAALFPEEFAAMKNSLSEFVEILFMENRFTEPALLRGVYFTGEEDHGTLVTLHSKKYLSSQVLESITYSAGGETQSRALFIKDLFAKKIFSEPGLVMPSRFIGRKNLQIKAVGALVLCLLVLIGAFLLYTVPKRSAQELRMFEATIRESEAALEKPKSETEMLSLCMRLAADRQRLAQKGFLARALGLGKFDALDGNLGTIHRSIFQQAVLQRLVNRVEDALSRWQGDRANGDVRFHLFAAAFQEYIKWGNPNFGLHNRIELLPFLDFLQVPLKIKYQYNEQFGIYLTEGGRSKKMVSTTYEGIIRQAMTTTRAHLRPSLPDANGNIGEKLTEAQWWLRLSILLQQFQKDYTRLLQLKLPDETATEEEMFSRYRTMRARLNRTDTVVRETIGHLKAGKDSNVQWVDVDGFYNGLIKASHGMHALQSALDKDRQALRDDYAHRINDPIVRLLPVVHALEIYPHQGWLRDILVRQLGAGHDGLTPDLGIGVMISTLLNEMQRYNQLIENFRSGFDKWRTQLPVQLTRLDNNQPPLQMTEFNQAAGAVQQRIRPLKELTGQNGDAAGSVNLPATGGDAAKTHDDKEDEEKKKALLSFWDASRLVSNSGQWLTVQGRVKTHAQTLYLQELFNQINLQQGILKATSWQETKSIEFFRNGDGIALAATVDDFLADWVAGIPKPLRTQISEEVDAGHRPELRNFEKLLKEATVFQEQYLPKLRVSASNYAKCIQAMNGDVALAWRALRNSSDLPEGAEQVISWNNFKSFSAFRESYEQERGSVCRVITRQMEQIQSHVNQVFKKELIASYRSETERILKKYHQLDIGTKFPFKSDGQQAESAVLLDFFNDLNTLSRRFELDKGLYRVGHDGKRVLISADAQSVVNELLYDQWRSFYEDCVALEAFLYKDRYPRTHKVKASMVPGPAGVHFHWLRIASGSGNVVDLNVYGEPVVEMTMLSDDGSVTIHGLDASKIPQASLVVARGDRSLLQMIYLFGKPMDAESKTWLVDIELPLSVSPSFSVNATIKFVFGESLPVLPSWNSNDGYAGFQSDND